MADRWSKKSIRIHWVVALMLVAMAIAGFVMTDLPADSEARRWIARLHTVSGLTLMALVVARLIVRRRAPKPVPLPVQNAHRAGIVVVHTLLYVVTFAIGASGFITARLSDQGWHEYLMGRLAEVPALEQLPSRTLHGWLVVALITLVAMHVVGVFVHELRVGGTLRRMIPFLK